MTLSLQQALEQLEQVPALFEKLERLEGEVKALKGIKRVYGKSDLEERGYSRDQAYRILHTYGYKQHGPWLITHEALSRYEAGLEPEAVAA